MLSPWQNKRIKARNTREPLRLSQLFASTHFPPVSSICSSVASSDLRCLRISRKPATTELCLFDANVCRSPTDVVVSSLWTNYDQSLHARATAERVADVNDLFLLFHPVHRKILDLVAKNCPATTPPTKTDRRDKTCERYRSRISRPFNSIQISHAEGPLA